MIYIDSASKISALKTNIASQIEIDRSKRTFGGGGVELLDLTAVDLVTVVWTVLRFVTDLIWWNA